jgi:hypothetical protein
MDSDSDTAEAVGCPIRKSMDQSLFAAPHGLSQRTTSFIASQRQGIHQMPFCHLIALIINAHPSGTEIDSELLVYINGRPCGRTPTLRPDFHRDRPNSRRFNTADLGGGFLHNNSRCCGRRKSQVDPLFTM